MSNSQNIPVPKAGVLDISAYVPGKSSVPDGVDLRKLSSNESPIGPSPKAVSAFSAAAGRLEDYPDGSTQALREAIGEVHGLDAANIICGNGSDEILSLLANAYLAPGDEAIFTEHGFLVYRIAILSAGGTPVVAPEKDCRADVDAILERVTPATKIIYLANPNNPTGTYLPMNEVERLHKGLPQTTVLVLDAAYAEYVSRKDYEPGIEMVSAHNNVVMTRTFSKIFGLAGLRIGWAYAPAHMVDAVNRIRGPFNVNAAGIAAGVAAIGDRVHVAQAIAHNEQWLPWVADALEALGLKVTPSVGNFLLIHFSQTPGKSAADADRYLTARGYVLRAVGGYGFPNALRMTIGDETANRGAVACLKKFLDAEDGDV